jgi:hypothetical protein
MMGKVVGVLIYVIFILLMLPLWLLYGVGWLLQLPWLAVKSWVEDLFRIF